MPHIYVARCEQCESEIVVDGTDYYSCQAHGPMPVFDLHDGRQVNDGLGPRCPIDGALLVQGLMYRGQLVCPRAEGHPLYEE